MHRALAVPLLPLFLSTGALAQRVPRLNIAGDIGMAIPLGAFDSDGASAGRSLGTSASLRLTRVFGIYASLERTSFPVSQTARAPGDGTWTDLGVGGGVRLWGPPGIKGRVHPWAQLGIGRHNVDAPIADPQYSVLDTKGILTIEGGAGIDIALGPGRMWYARPIVRYRRYSFSVDAPAASATNRISYFAIGIGLVLAVGPGAQPVSRR